MQNIPGFMTELNDSKDVGIKSDYERTVLAAGVSRTDYILDCFRRDFPDYANITYDQVNEFISRSDPLKRWFADIMETFRLTYEIPEVARSLLSANEFKLIKDKLTNYNKSLADESSEIAKAARNFSEVMKRETEKGNKIRESLCKDKLLRILTVKTSQLPMEYQFKIVKYEEEESSILHHDDGSRVTRREYVKKLHSEYIRYLFDEYRKGSDTNAIIDGNLDISSQLGAHR